MASIPTGILNLQHMINNRESDPIDTSDWDDLDYDLESSATDIAQSKVDVRVLEFILQKVIIPVIVQRRDDDVIQKIGGSERYCSR